MMMLILPFSHKPELEYYIFVASASCKASMSFHFLISWLLLLLENEVTAASRRLPFVFGLGTPMDEPFCCLTTVKLRKATCADTLGLGVYINIRTIWTMYSGAGDFWFVLVVAD